MPFFAISRPPYPAGDTAPVLVLLHGLAADENDLIGIASELDRAFHVVSFRAPYETGYGGYSWFGIEFLPDGSRIIDEDQARSSCAELIEALEALPQALAAHPSRLILGGFSQGAMMAAGVLMQRPDLIDGAWLMSGQYLQVLDKSDKPFFARRVLVQHGASDEVLAVTEGRELAAKLKVAGHIVIYHEYPMGHQINTESLADARAWMADLLPGQ